MEDPSEVAPERGRCDPWIGPVAVLVPIKAFSQAKLRLATALGSEDRAALAQRMAERVLAAASGLPTAVVCDDPTVAAFARDRGALVVWEPGRGLNGAVEAGVARLAGAGAHRVIVAHGDLPLATGLAHLDAGAGVTLVPDRKDDGTNVVCVPAAAGFRFAYGPGSFARHCAEVARLGLTLSVVRDPSLTFDVDVPDDLPGLAGTVLPRRPGVVSPPRSPDSPEASSAIKSAHAGPGLGRRRAPR